VDHSWPLKHRFRCLSFEHQYLENDKLRSTLYSRRRNVLDLSLCPSVCPSVRLFVRLLPTCERYTSKTNEPILMQIGENLPPGQSTSLVRRSKVRVTGRRSYYVLKRGGDIIFDPLSGVDRGIQQAIEMLPLKEGSVARSFNCSPTRLLYMHLADALVSFSF